MASYKVLTGALTLKLDKDGKKVKRFYCGQIVELQIFHDSDRLKSIGAIGDSDARFPTAAGLAIQAAQARQENAPVPVETGQVDEVSSELDDGGKGSDDVTPPAEDKPARAGRK